MPERHFERVEEAAKPVIWIVKDKGEGGRDIIDTAFQVALDNLKGILKQQKNRIRRRLRLKREIEARN